MRVGMGQMLVEGGAPAAFRTSYCTVLSRANSLRITTHAASQADIVFLLSPAQFRISSTSASVTVSPVARRYWAERIFSANVTGDCGCELMDGIVKIYRSALGASIGIFPGAVCPISGSGRDDRIISIDRLFVTRPNHELSEPAMPGLGLQAEHNLRERVGSPV
jgi:hypothetical protein